MRRVANSEKRIIFQLVSQDKEPVVIAESTMLLPNDFVNFNAALPWILRIKTQVKATQEISLAAYRDHETIPFYPYNYTFEAGKYVTQTDQYMLPISGVIAFVDFRE